MVGLILAIPVGILLGILCICVFYFPQGDHRA